MLAAVLLSYMFKQLQISHYFTKPSVAMPVLDKKPQATRKRKLEKDVPTVSTVTKDKENAVQTSASTEKQNGGGGKENTNEVAPRRSSRVTRSMKSMAEDGPPSPEKAEKKQLPFIKYRGEIKYLTDSNEIAESADSLLQWVEKQTHLEVVPVSFDMEWPFSFQTGPGKSSVIQLCLDIKCCYVYQLTNLKKIPAALMALLKHPKTRLHGVNIKNDFRKLARDFPEVDADVLIGKCVDLGLWCNEVCETGGRWSLERLANYIVEKAMDKSKKVRMSKWHVIPLDENQLMYAAIDVYIGQVIYYELEKREAIKKKNEAEFIEKNGETAFKAIKALGETFLTNTSDVTPS